MLWSEHHVGRAVERVGPGREDTDRHLRMDHAEPYELDPAGTVALREAKKVRRAALRRGGEEHVREQAQQHFGMPRSPLHYATGLPEPLYPPRADNN